MHSFLGGQHTVSFSLGELPQLYSYYVREGTQQQQQQQLYFIITLVFNVSIPRKNGAQWKLIFYPSYVQSIKLQCDCLILSQGIQSIIFKSNPEYENVESYAFKNFSRAKNIFDSDYF